MFDKWAHFAGSAAGVLLILALFRLACILGGIPFDPFTAWIGTWGGAFFILTLGLAYEIYQGLEAGRYEEAAKVLDGLPEDGFSILDLICNIAGIALVLWVLIL